MLTHGDRVIELRGASETPPCPPVTPQAERLTPDTAAQLTAPDTGRLVLCCTTGLRAWRVAEALRARGQTRLALMAASATDRPVQPRRNT